jgi:hypothetical protein
MTEDVINSIERHQRQFSPLASVGDQHHNMDKDGNAKSLIDDLESKMTLMEKENKKQLELAALRQKGLDQQEENRQLRERLAKMEARIQDNASNVLNHNLSNDKMDDGNDINYDSECSNSEEELYGINDTARMDVTEGNDDDLQNSLTTLKQSERDHQKENQRLKERLVRMEEAMQNNADNDLNYDSSDNESNDNSATNSVDVKKKDDYALQEERAALKQKELEQHGENQLLKERLVGIVEVQDDPHNDPYYNSSDNEGDDKNNTTANTQQRESHYHSVEIYADPNYDSSDDEDPRNDIYLD